MLNNLQYGTLYIQCIFVKPQDSMPTNTFVNSSHLLGTISMVKRIHSGKHDDPASPFGERLAALRKAAGFTQTELAAELGISQRMVAYYESPQAAPPANLLPDIANALGVSIDELFGRGGKRRLAKQEGDSRLRRRLLAIEKLEPAEKRQVLQLLDAFIERGQFKRQTEQNPA
ncbi:MAG: XRE family transcriptional regulator [Candidimonas sp.]|nr:MAG: XRE family transcriptional regulator [Candidimonas sp.]